MKLIFLINYCRQLTNRQVTNLRKAFANHTSAKASSKAQLTKIQKGGFLRFLAQVRITIIKKCN